MARATVGPWLIKQAIIEALRIPSPVIFDVGAHFGNVAEFYTRMFPKYTIHCFEPEPVGLARLEKRFAASPNIHVHPIALAHRRYSSKKILHVGGQQGEMSSLLPRPTEGRRYYRHHKFEQVKVTVDSIDQFCEEHSIKRVHILKLDVQGAELKVLEGASNLLTSGSIPLIYTEAQIVPLYKEAALLLDIWSYLKTFGYELFDVYGQLRAKVSRRMTVSDALFISPTVSKRIIDPLPEEWLAKSKPYALGAPAT